MGSRGPPSVHADQKAMEVTKTTDADNYEPVDPDEEEVGSQRKQKRAREGNYVQNEVPPSESGYNSEGEHTIAAANEPAKDANERPEGALYWAKIAPPDARQEQTQAQKDSAARITKSN